MPLLAARMYTYRLQATARLVATPPAHQYIHGIWADSEAVEERAMVLHTLLLLTPGLH